ncbi:hypothetical protein TrST_g12682 [Triparma strigata]|uniref:Acyl-coenzyme A oxidase n=1 Tax=Triparma strigata TaxID=1606541 RepID=A0A9W7BY48_9STRA|nr:hypothetical protein TrST_g12682 [Triparma strigata]
MPPPPNTSELLRTERSNSNINISAITALLDHNLTLRRREIESRIESCPTFSNLPNANLSRLELHSRALAKHIKMMEIARQLRISLDDCTSPEFVMLVQAVADDLPTLLHWGMFVPNIKCLCDDEQTKKWLPLCSDCRVVGCYAQTEMGHGSNVRGLETTAVYDKATESFTISTPTLTSTKFWPGSLGKSANTAMVIAQLIDSTGANRGVHNFIVPIRDLNTHSPLPGVTVGDIGSKLGYNKMDNGYLKLDRVVIPRENMAMRFSQINANGIYEKINLDDSTAKISYITMMQVRAQIVAMASTALAQACTISIRYSAVRTQGFDATGKKERQILDYVQQQHRLFGYLASSYTFFFSGRRIMENLKSIERGVLEGTRSVSKNQIGDLHASLSTLKAFCSTVAAEGIENCRRACGGHGYLVASGFPELLTTYQQNPTVEGDNYMLPQQTGKVLLKLLGAIIDGDGVDTVEAEWAGCDAFYLIDGIRRLSENSAAEVIESPEAAIDVALLLKILKRRSSRILVEVGTSINEGLGEGAELSEVWNDSLVQIARVSNAHAGVLLMQSFDDFLKSEELTGKELDAMKQLACLFGLMVVEKDAGDFQDILDKAGVDHVRKAVLLVLKKIRPNAVGLVDAFDFSDFRLKSVLGRYDGEVYEHLMKSCEADMMNRQQVIQPVVSLGGSGLTSKL